MPQPQRFEVALKAFVVRGDELLLLEESDGGAWELPGGRIEVGEERLAQREVLSRELVEELGPGVRIEIGTPVATWVREKADGSGFGFLVGLLCSYRGGDIRLSGEHSSFAWTTEADWRDRRLADGYSSALAGFWERRRQ